jgi:hypothetical protein
MKEEVQAALPEAGVHEREGIEDELELGPRQLV